MTPETTSVAVSDPSTAAQALHDTMATPAKYAAGAFAVGLAAVVAAVLGGALNALVAIPLVVLWLVLTGVPVLALGVVAVVREVAR